LSYSVILLSTSLSLFVLSFFFSSCLVLFVFTVGVVAATTVATLAITVGLGLAGTWRVLSRRPGPELREL
jgi:predicted lysophospholipase L1 biosynthesis ABC-type transport system permease subunit